MRLLLTLCDKKYKTHRTHTRKVKSFSRSFGYGAKTDALDTKALAHYGFERQEHLEVFKPLSDHSFAFFNLVQRRKDLTQMLVGEKNRLKAREASSFVKRSCETMMTFLNGQIAQITIGMMEMATSEHSNDHCRHWRD